MRLNLDTNAVSDAISMLRSTSSILRRGQTFGSVGSLTGFSPLTGFSTSGNTLGTISDSRAPEATEAVAAHMMGIATTLEVALQNAMWADNSISGMLASMGKAFGNLAVQTSGATFAMIDDAYSVDPQTNSFATPPAMAGPEFSLEALSGQLNLARIPDAAAASQFWNSNAAMLRQAVDDLNGVKQALASSAETVWVERAINTITQLQNASNVYAGNSQVMAGHTEALGLTAQSEKALAAASLQIARLIPDAAARASYESTYLGAYSPRVSQSLTATVPMFNRLLPDLRTLPGAAVETHEPTMPTVPNFSEKSLPTVVKDAMGASGFGDLAHASSPAEVVQRYGNVNPDTFQSIAAGATPTQAASAAAPTMSPPSAMSQLGGTNPMGGAVNGAGPGGGALTPASMPGLASAPGGPGGAAAAARPNALGGTAPFGAPFGAVGGSGASAGAGSASSAGSRGAHTMPGAGGRGFGGPGAGLGGGFSTNPTGGPGGGFGAGSAGGNAGTAPGAGGAVGGYAPAAGSAQGGAGARQGGVVGGPYGAAGNQNRKDGAKRAKVKTVTSAVEREGNLKALLGDAPLLLPSIIGHNVRG